MTGISPGLVLSDSKRGTFSFYRRLDGNTHHPSSKGGMRIVNQC